MTGNRGERYSKRDLGFLSRNSLFGINVCTMHMSIILTAAYNTAVVAPSSVFLKEL